MRLNPSARPARSARSARSAAALAAAVAAVCLSPAVPAIADDTPGRITPTHQVHVKLLRKAPTPTLKQIAPYTDALAVYTYEVVKPPKGGGFPDQITVAHWAVYRKAEQRVTDRKPGKKSKLTLAPWDAAKDRLQTVYRSDPADDADVALPLYFDVGQKLSPPPGEAERWDYGVDLSSMMPMFYKLRGQLKLVLLGDCQAWFANKAENFYAEQNAQTPVALNMCQQRSGLPFQQVLVEDYLVHLPELEWVVLTWNPRFVNKAWTEHGIKAERFRKSPGYRHDREHQPIKAEADRDKPVTVSDLTSHPRDARVWQGRPWGWVYLAPNRHRFNPRGEVLKVQKKGVRYAFVQDRWAVFEQIVETLHKHKIKLLVYTTPIHPETANQTVKDKMGIDAAGYQDQVRRIEALADRYPQTLFFYDLNNMGDNGLDDADFENIDHVDASGAEKVSRRVEAFRLDVERRLADQP